MNISEFVAVNAAIKPNADIVERWESRVVANGMNIRGAKGAEAYLGQYGKGMKAQKAIMFARIAEIKGFPEMANRFWEEAFFLAHGARQALGAGGAAPIPVVLPTVALKLSFGRVPQLPVVLDEATAMQLLLDDDYGVQEKKDGRNLMTDVEESRVTGGNKKGLVSVVPLAAADAMASLGRAQLDNEDVAGICFAFDLLSLNGENLRRLGYQDRHARLLKAAAALDPKGALRVIPLVVGRAAKQAFVKELRDRKAEGFILKRLNAPYKEGASDQQWKFQFRATNAFVVGERNGSKSSVGISVYRTDGSLRDMGGVTIPANRTIPAPGAIVEVEYLYCHIGKAGKLHQPVFKGTRDDVEATDCTDGKLKVKAEQDDE